MAGGLGTLIRLRRWRLDEERRQLAERLRALELLQEQQRALAAEILEEQEHAREAPAEAGFAWAGYARAAIARRETLAQAIGAAEAELTSQREVVQGCYRELRTFELAEEARRRRKAEEAGRLERIALDEIALLSRSRTQPS